MLLMEKDGIKFHVADCHVNVYFNNGWKEVGETLENRTVDSAEAFVCPHCGKEYSSSGNLERHIRTKHAE